ncbi:cell division protein FtsL [Polyangium mundeleinium]|uniref:Cell division protein FtsL n=1 Tax=Polyangium mundeleinium TaxID=2995306 RepID=A0ABT5EJJ6_9BACT|nr:cell division protein FtsL [Polyangium mundeleinium]MDC0741532.1 cell division protein FtsL [Polyangium mundeleinium]
MSEHMNERMKQRPFLALWSLAVVASVAAFVVHLGLRGRIVDLGYKLGRARAEQGRLREVKRVLSLEAASYETPQRVEMVARTLLGMTPPPPERVIPVRWVVKIQDEPSTDGAPPGEPGSAPSPPPDPAAPSGAAGSPVPGGSP